MNRTVSYALRSSAALALILVACLIPAGREQDFAQKPPPRGTPPPSQGAPINRGGASLQSHRNIGRAYYEQGKYAEAIKEFQQVVASPATGPRQLTGSQGIATDHLDLGLAFLQANQYDQALGELTTARQMGPRLVAAEYNLGILYKRELRYPDAEAALKRVIAADPNDPAAWFNLGTVYFAEKKLEEALDAHQHVVAMGFGRGQNFYVASLFHTFTTLVRLKRQAEAQKMLKLHEKFRDKVPGISLQNPALEGGKYGAILVPSTPPVEIARRLNLDHVTFTEITQRLGISLPPQSVGRGATPDASKALPPWRAVDYSLEFARRNLVPLFGPSLAVGDYDGDGRPDLYVVNPAGSNSLFHNNADGTFTDVTEKAGVAGPGASVAAAFADFDNSGKPSLFVAGLDGVKLYRNQGDGTFKDETEKAGLHLPPGELDTAAVLFDADNDGFLDLFVTAYSNLNSPPQKDSFRFPDDFTGATSHFYRNNGDGTFTELTESSGLASAAGRMRGAVFADLNNSGYSDLLLFRDDAPPLLYENRGDDKFVLHKHEPGSALAKTVAYNVQVADFNHDGYFDLVVWSPGGFQVLLNRGGWKFTPASPSADGPNVPPPSGFFSFRGTVADLKGDSFPDLLALDAGGKCHFLANTLGRFREGTLTLPAPYGISGPAPEGKAGTSSTGPASGLPERKSRGEQSRAGQGGPAALASLVPTWLGSPGKLNLVGITRNGQLVAYEKAGPPARWMEVKLNGFKSNMQGIGSIVEFKAGNFYDKVVVTGNPVRVFTGELTKLDVVRVTWPNAVIQNWIDVATNKPIEVRESERLASSCPLLYAWDGRKYVFLTDVLGVAPLGELAPDGSRVKPFPEDLVRLPENLRPQNGNYVFQLTDELREVDYFDQVRLWAVDHPSSQEIYSNEIYSSTPERPKLYAVSQKRFPVTAVDDHGRDVLPLILKAEGRYPTDFLRQRILGLAELHSLTLDLGEWPSSRRGQVALWLKGFVFWTDSNASRALMSNKRLKMVPPYLQVRDAQGEWVTMIPDLGLPSGTNRTMRVDLSGKFLSSDHHVRIVTNLCVYWDQIFFTTQEAPLPPSAAQELPLASADLHYRGFSTPVSDPHHLQPDYFEYAKRMTNAPWNPMLGNYTRYGAVEELLTRSDNRLVVMATGDELTVRFSGRRLPPLRPGWKRDFFLYVSGWAKDGEPNTAFAKTVSPLPFREMSNYPPRPEEQAPESLRQPEYRKYLREYLTRPGYALIPPLAPAVEAGFGIRD
jgi:Tfp pilus assembly protein PilF